MLSRMTTATAERDALVSQPARDVTFAARRTDLQLIQTARYPILNAQGAKTGTETPGITYQFVDGLLRIPAEGMILTKHGLEVEAQQAIDWLRSHRLYGDRFEGFFEIEQTAPPVSAEEMMRLMELAQTFNREALEEVREQELAGWNRPEILQSVERSIRGIEELEAKAAQQAKGK